METKEISAVCLCGQLLGGSCRAAWGHKGAEFQEQGGQGWKEMGHGAVLGDNGGSPGAQVSAQVSLGC